MEIVKIDMNRIREALPERAIVTLMKKNSVCIIDCKCYPYMSESDFEMCKNWQREIIGRENIMEFYTEETGSHWKVYLKRVPMAFQNTTDVDHNSFAGMEIVRDGKVNVPE